MIVLPVSLDAFFLYWSRIKTVASRIPLSSKLTSPYMGDQELKFAPTIIIIHMHSQIIISKIMF